MAHSRAVPRELEYWAAPAPMTDLSAVPAHVIAGLPDDPVELCRIASGVMVHEAWAPAYGFQVPPDRVAEVELRPAAAIVDAILALDDRPLVEPRPAERRAVGVCRHFTTLSVALLRAKGIPARSRCGFGSYFEHGKYIDHWIVERWDDAAARWRGVDTQFDEVATKVLRLDFDPTDVPHDRFYTGGAAWELARSGDVESESFGIYDFWGWPMLRGNLIRDIAALNKVELLPWDLWGGMNEEDDPDAYGDELARASVSAGFDEVRDAYEDARVRVPEEVVSARFQHTVKVPSVI
jgi:hypothetical protein